MILAQAILQKRGVVTMSQLWDAIPPWYHQDVMAVLFLLAVFICLKLKPRITPRGSGSFGCATENLFFSVILIESFLVGSLLWAFIGFWTVVIAVPLAYFFSKSAERWQQPEFVLAIAVLLVGLGHVANPNNQLDFFKRFAMVEASRYEYPDGPDAPELTDELIQEIDKVNNRENSGRKLLVASAELRIKGLSRLSRWHHSSCLMGLGLVCFIWFLAMPIPPETTKKA